MKPADAARAVGDENSQGLRDVLGGRKRLSAELLSALVQSVGISAEYVLTGTTEEESLRQREALHAAAGVPKAQREAQRAEAELLSNYRACPPDIQDALRKMAASAAQKKA